MVQESIKRSSENQKVIILKKGELEEANLNEFISNLKPKVDGIIRVPKNDLWYFDESSKYLTHFNLECTGHVLEKNYLLPKIVENGYYMENGEEKLPVLDFKLCLMGKCVEVKNNVSYDDLKELDFEYSFENIKSIEDLKKVILERYSKSLPDLTEEEILSLGVGITKLEIIGRNKKF